MPDCDDSYEGWGEYMSSTYSSYVHDKWELKSNGKKMPVKHLARKTITTPEELPAKNTPRYREFLAGLFGQNQKNIRLVVDADMDVAVPCLSMATEDPDQTLEVRFVGKNQHYRPGSNRIGDVRLPDSMKNDNEEIYGFYFTLHETRDKYKSSDKETVIDSSGDIEYYTDLEYAKAYDFMNRDFKARSLYFLDCFNAQANLGTYWLGLKAHIDLFLR